MTMELLAMALAVAGLQDVESLDLTAERCVKVECEVRSEKQDNPFFAVILEHGQPNEANGFRLSFNDAYRERRLRATWGAGKAETDSFALDDEKWHHVAFEMEVGKKGRLTVDGKTCGEFPAASGFIKGKLHVGVRDGRADSREDTFNRFRGSIRNIKVAGRVFSDVVPSEIDPDPAAAQWARPETTRRYLQGPLSERLLTMWREGKIMYGEVCHEHDWRLNYEDQIGHGVWLVHGAKDEPFDFKLARSVTPADGTPIHALAWHDGSFEVTMTACAAFGRRPTAQVRLTVANCGATRERKDYAFLLRTGRETDLLFSCPDVYRPFAPTPCQWETVRKTWRRDADGICRDGDRFAAFGTGDFSWDETKGALRFSADLGAGETRTVEFSLGRGETIASDFAATRTRMISDWQRELARMKTPAGLTPERARIARNLVTQTLQMMAVPSGAATEPILPRQGGMQRFVWPYESMPVMAALALYGYGDYVEKTISLYFDHYQRDNGNVWCAKFDWACITGVAIGTFARYCCDTDNAAFWKRYRDKAFKSFDWVCAKRRESAKDPTLIPGLFPPMRSSDWEEHVQHWAGTDLYNLEALAWFVRAVERFGDPNAERVRAEYEDYRGVLTRILDKFRAECAGRDELRIPVLPTGDDEKLLATFYPAMHYGLFAQEGFLTTDEMYRVKLWLERRGMANGKGLYGFFPNFAGRPKSHRHHWYTSYGDTPWFFAWLKAGRRDLAEEILDAQFKWSMTENCYMGERYDDTCPWYFPWSPNASANGRTLLMLRSL